MRRRRKIKIIKRKVDAERVLRYRNAGTKLFEWLLKTLGIVVILRPLSFYDAGDAKIYFKGASQILEGINVYEIDREPFGTRFFNGPIFGMVHSLFLGIPENFRLISYRLLIISSTICLILLVSRIFGLKKLSFQVTLLILLCYPSRMSVNLAQGAVFAFLAGIAAIIILTNKELSRKKSLQLLSIILFAFSLNYKPLILVPLCVYLVCSKRHFFLIKVAIFQFAFDLILISLGRKASTFGWIELLLERSTRISDQGSSNILGPYALLGKLVTFPVAMTMFVPIFGIVLILIFSRRHLYELNRKIAVLALGAGCFMGPYSPGQDWLLLEVVAVIWTFSQKTERPRIDRRVNSALTMALALWSLPTERNLVSHLLLAVLVGVCISHKDWALRKGIMHSNNFVIFFLCGAILEASLQFFHHDHAIYDLTALAPIICLMLYIFNLQPKKLVFHNA